MKRLLAGLLCAALLFCLCACGHEAVSAPTLLLRYADNQPKGYPTTEAAEYFARLLEERTGGRIRIRIYADAELGDEISVFRQLQFGGIDFTRVSVGTLAGFVPEMVILQLPYLFEDAEHMWRVLDGEIGEELLGTVADTGVTGLSWFDAGARNIYTRVPVRSLDDLEGLTIRVQESDFMSRMIRLWGASPVQMPYGEVYSALQTGRIDGAENNWPSYETTGHYEAAPYYLLDAHSRLPELQLVSRITLDKIRALDPDYEELLYSCAREAALYERALWQERERSSEALVRASGCIVTEPDEKELDRFRSAVQPLYGGFSDPLQQLIERIRQC
ncbi:MAG: TRAP transporter substrate-binding protein [Oscillospiraceae bacterium]|nr:TRAP transporter substrate-binding protein [Oscillospiraceae bacterium]